MKDTFLKQVEYSSEDDFSEYLGDQMKEYKIIHLTGVPREINHKAFYADLVDQMGEVVNVDEDVKTGHSIPDRWTDIRYDSNMGNFFRHSNTRQPLHTDGAYMNTDLDVNFFFCVQKAEIGGATTFIDAPEILYILKKYEPALLRQLETYDVFFGKGDDQRKKSKVISYDERGARFNWNFFRVSPENSDDVKQMAEAFHQFLEKKVVEGGLLFPLYLNVGEAVFFQDDRILHGRNSFYGHRNLVKGGFNFAKSAMVSIAEPEAVKA